MMNRKIAVLVVAALCLAVPVAATEVQFTSDQSRFHLTGSGGVVSINMTDNASSFTVMDDRLVISGHNFSIENTSTQPIQVQLHAWNIEEQKDPLVNFTANTSASHNVTFGISNLAADTNYSITKDGSFYRQVTSNAKGNISFFIDTWSPHTITVASADTQPPSVSLSLGASSITEGDSITINCSASDESGIQSTSLTITNPDGTTYSRSCGVSFSKTSVTGTYNVDFTAKDSPGNTNTATDTFDVTAESTGGTGDSEEETGTAQPTAVQGWVGVNRSRFTLVDQQQETGVKSVQVTVAQPLQEFRLRVTRLDGKPSRVTPVSRPYRFWEITQEGTTDNAIVNTTITFEVNQSFARRVDRVALARYRNSTGTWEELPTDPVNTTGQSWLYRATSTGFSYYAAIGINETQPQNVTDNRTEQNQTMQPRCGNGVCGLNETWKTCQQDCSKPIDRIKAEQAIEEAAMWIDKGDTGYQQLQSARHELDQGNYTGARRLAETALERYREKQHLSGRQRIPIRDAAIVLVFLILVVFLYRRWKARTRETVPVETKPSEEPAREAEERGETAEEERLEEITEAGEEQPAPGEEAVEREEREVFVCPVCGDEFDTEHGLEVHEGMAHEDEEIEPVPETKRKHAVVVERYVCRDCGDTFDTEHGLEVHRGMEH